MTAKSTEKIKEFRTLSDVMNEPSGECLDIIARVAPAIERFANKSGIIGKILEKQGTAESVEQAVEIVELTASAVLRYALGECQSETVEIVAAVNGLTVDQVRNDYTGWELAKMVKAVVMDKGFLSSVRTLLD
jgi:hypothetical protein